MTFLVQAYPTAAGYQLGSTCCHGQTQLHCASRAIINYTVDICDSYNSVLEGPLWQQLTKGGTSSPSSTTYPPPHSGRKCSFSGNYSHIFKCAHFTCPPPHSGRKYSFSGNYSHIFQKVPILLTRTPANAPKVTNNSLRPTWHPSTQPGTIIDTINESQEKSSGQ